MNSQIYEEASDWLVKHRDGGLDTQDKAAFDAWLRESPQHVRAYLEMSSLWEDVPLLDRDWNPSAEELIARARTDGNVVPLSSPQRPATAPTPTTDKANDSVRDRVAVTREPVAPRTRKATLWYSLAASVLVALIGGWFYLQHGVYSTGTGEQRSLVLADGSTVELNSRSRIKVRYDGHERRIDLLEGQALFHVAKNKERPFIVSTDDSRVRAVGTSFDVYKKDSGTVVTVIEGRVAVHGKHAATRAVPDSPAQTHADAPAVTGSSAGIQAAAGEVLLADGEQLVVTLAAVTEPKQANLAAATAWTRRSLVFDSSALTEVAEEFNRYNTRRLVIESPQLAGFHISGVFSSVEPTLLLRFLRAQPELVVEETPTEIRVRSR